MKESDKVLWEAFVKDIIPIRLNNEQHQKQKNINSVVIANVLDLHNYAVQDAFKAFNEFTAKHIELNSRKVLVITGKSGIIKAEFETWAKTNKHIQYFELKNGGGAFSIKFKKY